MKQFLIVLLATAAVFVGWRVYSTSTDEVPQKDPRPLSPAKPPKTQRPKTGVPSEKLRAQTPEGEVEVEKFADNISQEEFEEKLSGISSWTQYVQEDDIVKLEDAWGFDFSGVDYDADVLAAFESPSGRRLEITQNDWRRYVCLSLGLSFVRAKLFADRARMVSATFGEAYGLPDEVWGRFAEELAKSRGMTLDEYEAYSVQTYGLDEEASMLARRNSIEGLFAHLPPVNEAGSLPRLTRRSIENEKDQALLMTLAAAVRESRKDFQDGERLAALAKLVDGGVVHLAFTRSMPEHEFRHTWSFLDADGVLPANAVAGGTLGEIETEELRPPWLQPGDASFVTVEELWPHIPELMPDQKVGMLRELTWYFVLRNQLDEAGQLPTPEENWLAYADEYMRRDVGVLNMSAHTSTIARFPSTHHYRAFSGVSWAFEDHLPEGWDSESNLRAFYDRNRIFVESWTPAMEAILFPAVKFEDGYAVDWEGAHQQAEEARARVLAGEEDFSEMRNRLHLEHRERLLAAGLHDLAHSFDEAFQNGMLAARMPKLERSFSESPFSLMVDATSVIRNAVARLDPGEISPIWRVPIGYTILRVHGVGATDLEGTFDDYEFETKFEYGRSKFWQWANTTLKGVKLLE